MKSIATVFALTCLLAFGAFSQDLIITTNKQSLETKVAEITSQTVKYRLWEHQEGPVYNIDKAEVFMIKYENGRTETFEAQNQPSTQPQPEEAKKAKETQAQAVENQEEEFLQQERKEETQAPKKTENSRISTNIELAFMPPEIAVLVEKEQDVELFKSGVRDADKLFKTRGMLARSLFATWIFPPVGLVGSIWL